MTAMAIFDSVARGFGMSDEVWQRHASGWSVWTRVATGPLIFLAIWSHVWWGWVPAALALAALVVWFWLNPRLFPKPKTTDSWHSKATLGERVWLNRSQVPIPAHHARAAALLTSFAGVGTLVGLYGAVTTQLWPTLLGIVAMYAGKLWFCDRMVWLYEDMKQATPRYRSWLY